MNITTDCVECIVGQIEKATKHLNLDEKLSNEIMTEVHKRSKNFSFNCDIILYHITIIPVKRTRVNANVSKLDSRIKKIKKQIVFLFSVFQNVWRFQMAFLMT